jgi:hypothetical protein
MSARSKNGIPVQDFQTNPFAILLMTVQSAAGAASTLSSACHPQKHGGHVGWESGLTFNDPPDRHWMFTVAMECACVPSASPPACRHRRVTAGRCGADLRCVAALPVDEARQLAAASAQDREHADSGGAALP